MELTAVATSTADPARCWTALSEVTDWPNWTKSIDSVTPLDGPGLAVGKRFRISQPGMPAMVWTVTELHDGESFTWEARATGVLTIGWHRLQTGPDGTGIDIGARQSGPLAWLIGALTGSRTRRYLAMEAAGLKAASESG